MAFDAGASDSYFVSRTIGANSTNSTLILGSPCWFCGYTVGNINAAPVYLKIYDKVTAPTVGTDVPIMTIMIPGSAAGAGANIEFKQGVYIAAGLGFGLVNGIADNDTTAPSANQQVINILYRKS